MALARDNAAERLARISKSRTVDNRRSWAIWSVLAVLMVVFSVIGLYASGVPIGDRIADFGSIVKTSILGARPKPPTNVRLIPG
jgi:hypothetical protein